MFRFTIRELMLLTLVAAIVAAWGIDHSQLMARCEGRLGLLDRLVELDVQRSIARTHKSHANDCRQSLQSLRK